MRVDDVLPWFLLSQRSLVPSCTLRLIHLSRAWVSLNPRWHLYSMVICCKVLKVCIWYFLRREFMRWGRMDFLSECVFKWDEGCWLFSWLDLMLVERFWWSLFFLRSSIRLTYFCISYYFFMHEWHYSSLCSWWSIL